MGRKDKPIKGDHPGAKLRQIRQEHNISLSKLSTIVLYSKSHLSNIENGVIRPSAEVIEAYNKALNTQIDIATNNKNNVTTENTSTKTQETFPDQAPLLNQTLLIDENHRSSLFGRLVQEIRRTKPSMRPSGRSSHMSQWELTELLTNEMKKFQGTYPKHYDLYSIEKGKVRITRTLAELIITALNATILERALLLEIAGFNGCAELFMHLAKADDILKVIPQIIENLKVSPKDPETFNLKETKILMAKTLNLQASKLHKPIQVPTPEIVEWHRDFGQLLRMFRTRAGLSFSYLEERTNLARSTIYRFESNKSHPNRASVQKLAEALGLTPNEKQIFFDTSITTKPPRRLRH